LANLIKKKVKKHANFRGRKCSLPVRNYAIKVPSRSKDFFAPICCT